MWKMIIATLIVFTAITSGLLLWQWKSFTQISGKMDDDESEQVLQHISIEAYAKELIITQTITGLSNGREYQVIKPEQLFRWRCKDAGGDNCSSRDENPVTFLADRQELRFHYVIPRQKQSAFFLTEWTTSIPAVEVIETTIEIAEKERRGSAWVAGIPQKGFESLSVIDYYLFKGKGDTPSLYWQAAPLHRWFDHESFSILSQAAYTVKNEFQQYSSLRQEEFLAIIMTDEFQSANEKGIKIVPVQSTMRDIERELIYSFYKDRFVPLRTEEQWIFDFFTALTLEEPSAIKRSQDVLEELSSMFTDQERQAFLQAVQQEKQKLDFGIIDQLVGSQKGLQTDFFSINKNENHPMIPLRFWDPRIVNVNEKDIAGLQVRYSGNDAFFPFKQTMEALGFAVKTSDDKIFHVTDGEHKYVFYLELSIFHYNGDDFGLLETPLQKENGIIYIKSKSLQSILHVSIKEDAKTIELNNRIQ